jgi:hypothetical protein
MSFETISVQIPGGPGDWDQAAYQARSSQVDALLVLDARVQGAYGAEEVRLRLPQGGTRSLGPHRAAQSRACRAHRARAR